MLYLRRPQKIRDNTPLVRKGFQLGVVFVRGFSADGRSPLYSSWPEYPARCRHDQPPPKATTLQVWRSEPRRSSSANDPGASLQGYTCEKRYAGGCPHGGASYTPFDTREPMPEERGSPHYVQLNRTESCETRIYPPAQDKLRLI